MARRAHVLVAVALVSSAVARDAAAQDFADLPPAQGDQPASLGGVSEARPFWESGDERAFVAALFDVGVVYLRPTLQVGYGKPHLEWFGAEVSSNVNATAGATYGGLKGELSFLTARTGLRYTYPFEQKFLRQLGEYSVEHSRPEVGPRSRYAMAEGEVTLTTPAPGGSAFLLADGYYIAGVPDGYNVWEESLHVIVDPPWLWRGRAGYRLAFGEFDTMKIGPAVEVIGIPNRDTLVARAGPVLSLALTHHMEAVAAIMVTFAARDSLGLRGADLGQLGLRYRWATGDRWPEFP